jgi:class 3 adenylate cyclase/tetratricopeptide (TPR) repeat protein
MVTCAVCGYEAVEAFKFCPECGAAAAIRSSERRKVVTVLFCDVVGSTALAESTDPEALRALLVRYFGRMKGIVERHGGAIEKFIGDAVMAVFGIPVAHEDDALRACRAAMEMLDSFPALGIEGRIGLNTGEVVTGTQERLATGDPVNVAARLQQAAQPGDVLIGRPTLKLLRGAVEIEALEPLTLKGKAQRVEAYRLRAMLETPEHSHEARFVGREQELVAIHQVWQRALAEQRCQLFTIVGEAGVGKSRLVAEALSTLEATAVQGGCLPYGKGITYWPVVEVIKQLAALPSDPAAAASIRVLLGETHEGTSTEEIAWAFRKLLEEQAPLIAVFDDIQWGEETFLDLVEGVALLASEAPILLLCMARTDLADRRPQWPAALRLEPLEQDDVDSLLPETIPARRRAQIARAAGGNPLFVTEMVAMAAESEGEGAVPPTLQALLAARLDQLEAVERSVLEQGAVEGEIFHHGAVQALSQDNLVTPRLASLVRKGLIHPHKTQIPGEDAFRFRHLLIRDAAYDALPKATRAELHEAFADWLEVKGRDLVELEELLGFHLERAARYVAELGQPDQALAERAGERLAMAGHRALSRDDVRAAAPLLERALDLTRPLHFDVHLELDLADSLQRPREQAAIAKRAALRAREAGDRAGEALGLVVAAEARNFAGDPAVDELERLARMALPLLRQVEDDAGLARVWNALGFGANARGRFDEAGQAAEQALRHCRLAGQIRFGAFFALAIALIYGPQPADKALQKLDSILPANAPPSLLVNRAQLLAMLGRLDEAWALALPAAERLRGLSGGLAADCFVAEIATLAGDHVTAVDLLRGACDTLERQGNRALLSTYAPVLGRSLCALGRYDEAEPLAQLGRQLGDNQDLLTQMLWRQVHARVHAHRGDHAEAGRLAREAGEIGEQTDALNAQGDACCDLAEVLAAADRTKEAANVLEQALVRYEGKKNIVMAGRVRARLAERQRSETVSERA